MPNQTKEELYQIIAEKDAIIADLREQLGARDATLRGSSEPGWLITTRNPDYTGVVLGIQFAGGRAFLPKGKPNAERVLQQLVSDFGYQVEEVTANQVDAPKRSAKKDEREFINTISQPNIVS